MNNRYIFRGKREDNGEWAEGDLMQWNDGTIRICVENGNDEKTATTVIPETVGQCTGLTDKNGKLIFEGDIVEYLDSYSDFNSEHTEFINRGKVAYGDGACFIANRSSVEMSDLVYKNEFDGIVIGNIYDNPELLEAQNG